EEGKSMAGQLTKGGGKYKEIPQDPVRAQLHTQAGSLIPGSQKGHKLFDKLGHWLATNRSGILTRMKNSPVAQQDLKLADKHIMQALQLSMDLYEKYHKELSATIKDPDKLDAE